MKRLTFTLPLLFLLLVTQTGCKEENSIQPNTLQTAPIFVKISEVQKEVLGDQVEILGTVQAAHKAVIASRINGHIIEMPVVVGSRVKKGDSLIEISAGEISAQLLQASAQLNQAERNLLRERKLLQQNAATSEGVKTQEDIFKIAKALYKEAQTMLSYAQINAPFDGIVTQEFVNIGDLATQGKPLIHLENETDLQVLTDIPEAMVLRMRIGDSVKVSIPAAKISPSGHISEIAPTTDPHSRTTPVKIDLPHHSDLRSGQFARVFLTETPAHTLTIPSRALSSFGQIVRVFLFEQNKAHLRLVRVGKTHDGRTEILSGVIAGDRIILPGDTPLHDGQDVKLVND